MSENCSLGSILDLVHLKNAIATQSTQPQHRHKPSNITLFPKIRSIDNCTMAEIRNNFLRPSHKHFTPATNINGRKYFMQETQHTQQTATRAAQNNMNVNGLVLTFYMVCLMYLVTLLSHSLSNINPNSHYKCIREKLRAFLYLA